MRRWYGRVREFRACVKLKTGDDGWWPVLVKLCRGGLSAWRARKVVDRRVRMKRWRVCRGCPLLDVEMNRCSGCGCYGPFLVTVNQDCHARRRLGELGPWVRGWGKVRR